MIQPVLEKTKVKGVGRGRKRRTLGWSLFGLGLLVAGGWASSLTRLVSWRGGTSTIMVSGGQAVCMRGVGHEPEDVGWQNEPLYDNSRVIYWRATLHDGFPFRRRTDLFFVGYVGDAPGVPGIDMTTVVLWPIPLLLWTPAALLLRSGYRARRRATMGKCSKCGYSLDGLAVNSVCPECGGAAGRCGP